MRKPKPLDQQRPKFLCCKMSLSEFEMAERVAESLHLTKSESIRLLFWQKYDQIIKNSYNNSSNSGLFDDFPKDFPENISNLEA